ncbi:hypothetical protein [Streptomyces sp. AA1529]|uniref:hypothetical protein n=1 Tax=Streptomyces sp. AA1529 TaxID=1203257 RepID=UPI0004105DD7
MDGTTKVARWLLVLFLAPVCWGLFQLAGALPSAQTPRCPGTVLDEDGEELPQTQLRPGQTCHTQDGLRPTGSRTFEEAENLRAQKQRELLAEGALFTFYGAGGLALVLGRLGPPWRRPERGQHTRSEADGDTG